MSINIREWLAVSHGQALRFFFERLKDVANSTGAAPTPELLYNASVLAHFATTSTDSIETFPPTPRSLAGVLDVFILDRSGHADPEIMEAAASQCLLLTGFFGDQQRGQHNLKWFAAVGAGFYEQAANLEKDRDRSRMMETMAARFGYWRRQQIRLARDLRESGSDLNSMIVRL